MKRLRALGGVAVTVALALGLGGGALAQCRGQNLLDELPPEQVAALRQATDAVPFARGNAWRAVRGDEVVTIVGTLHLDDPRHDATMTALLPILSASAVLMVEAGPVEQARLMALMARDPKILITTKGPTLREALSDADWQALSAAMAARGVPGFMTAKLQPWYVSVLLAVPPCAMVAGVPQGLDQRLIAAAERAAVPIVGLEPFDTAFKVFQAASAADQIKMLTGALAAEPQSEDMTATMINSYFAEDTWLSWEFTKLWTTTLPGYDAASAKVEFAMIEDQLMTARNAAWIPVIEAQAATAGGPVFVAFGALHLAGEQGVLNLLQKQGFTLERIEFQ